MRMPFSVICEDKMRASLVSQPISFLDSPVSASRLAIASSSSRFMSMNFLSDIVRPVIIAMPAPIAPKYLLKPSANLEKRLCPSAISRLTFCISARTLVLASRNSFHSRECLATVPLRISASIFFCAACKSRSEAPLRLSSTFLASKASARTVRICFCVCCNSRL